MSLPVTNLDDRKFQDLVDEAKRMIPQLCPEWTNHNLSDPGVALIELFAWMTEMTLFRLNQVPDTFYTRMLNLLGFEQFPASAARTELTFWLSGATSAGIEVPQGTEVTTLGTVGEPRVFTTMETVAAVQPVLVSALTSDGPDRYTNVWGSLSLGLENVTCFPRTPLTPGDAFYLGFEQSLKGNAIRLGIEATVEGIGVNPDRPPLVWEVWQGEGWVRASVPDLPGEGEVADSTGGLNRNGHVLLLIRSDHQPLTLGGVRAHWLRARLIEPAPGQAAYRASPQIRRVTAAAIGMTVEAEHSERIDDEFLGTSTGKPNQVFEVSRRPVLPRDGHEVLEVSTPLATTEWVEVNDFVDSGPNDLHYMWDSSTGKITFGPVIRYPDGSVRHHGTIPPEGARLRLTSYRTGGGALGNVGVGTLTGMRSAIPYVSGVSNLVPATGGVDAETVENAKRRGPQSVRAGGRAVTVSDFERLAGEADSRVARVRCLAPEQPGDPVRLFVVPHVKQRAEMLVLDDFALPDDMIARIAGYLDERRVLGSTIEIGTPYYQGVTVASLLTAQPGRPASLVRDRAQRALYDYINPITGGSDRHGWAFDTDLNSANIFQVLEAVEGVEKVDEVLFFEYDLRNHERMGFGKELVKLAPDSLFLSTNHHVVVQ
ncbi:MAG: putative baseplate assembly protein [Ilumatobacter sp.]|uniref:putative baseplate assembly protein n=1 Tax=Ilumatobacter sp. TaxID=1967498 RepID=UPI00391DB22D